MERRCEESGVALGSGNWARRGAGSDGFRAGVKQASQQAAGECAESRRIGRSLGSWRAACLKRTDDVESV